MCAEVTTETLFTTHCLQGPGATDVQEGALAEETSEWSNRKGSVGSRSLTRLAGK